MNTKNIDEMRDLMLLAADGGLDAADAQRLQEALNADPALKNEWLEISSRWSVLRRVSATLGLPKGFCEGELDALRRPRPDGLFIGSTIRIAAAVLFMAALVQGMSGPFGVGRVRGRDADGVRARTYALHASTPIQVLEHSPIHGSLDNGTTFEIEKGQVTALSSSEMRIHASAASTYWTVGPEPLHLVTPEGTLVARNARFRLEVRELSGEAARDVSLEPSVMVRVDRGAVHRGALRGPTLFPTVDLQPLRPLPVRKPNNGEGGVPDEIPRTPLPDAPLDDDETPGTEDSTDPEQEEGSGDQDENAVTNPDAGTPYDPEILSQSFVYGLVTCEEGSLDGSSLLVLLRSVPLPLQNESAFFWERHDVRLANAAMLEALERESVSSPLQATVSTDGYFELTSVPAGAYEVTLKITGGEGLGDVAPRRLMVPPRSELELNVEVPAGQSYAGRITDRRGRSVPGALVHTHSQMVLADRDGRFQLERLATFGTVIWVDADGFVPLQLTSDQLGEDPIVVQDGAPVRGFVTSETGGEVHARVSAQWIQSGRFKERMVECAGDGSFHFDEVPINVAARLVITAQGFEPQQKCLNPFQGRERSWYFTMKPAGEWIGLVTDVQGFGIGDATHRVSVSSIILRGFGDELGQVEIEDVPFELCPQVIRAPGRRVLVRDVSATSAPESVVLQESSTRVLHVVPDSGEPEFQDAWALWCVRDASNDKWIDVKPLRQLAESSFELPSVALRSTGLEVSLWIGARNVDALRVNDELIATEMTVVLGSGPSDGGR